MAGPSGDTTRLVLPYPTPDDNVDVPRDIQALATALDGTASAFLHGTAAGRPAAGTAGRWYYATDTGLVSYDTGSAWIALAPGALMGTFAAIPAAGQLGRTYWVTDKSALMVDTGSAWRGIPSHQTVNFKILWGFMSGAGALSGNSPGLTASRTAAGNYQYNFTSGGFAAAPAAIVTPQGGSQIIYTLPILTATGATSAFAASAGGPGVDHAHTIVVIGTI